MIRQSLCSSVSTFLDTNFTVCMFISSSSIRIVGSGFNWFPDHVSIIALQYSLLLLLRTRASIMTPFDILGLSMTYWSLGIATAIAMVCSA